MDGTGDDAGTALETAILDLLGRRATGATICPSEAARRVAGTGGAGPGGAPDEAWRALLPDARAAAARLVAAGRIVVTQRGEVVDLAAARGPVRLRLT